MDLSATSRAAGDILRRSVPGEVKSRWAGIKKPPGDAGGLMSVGGRCCGARAAPALVLRCRLLSSFLARRIECAGVVDLGDLMVAEAQHLAQDLVGVLAE